jgi:hypothetical protein
MSTLTLAEPVNALLRELSLKNARDIIKDYIMTEVLCKISDFSQECTHFREKYGNSLEVCKAAYEAGEENFAAYDDLMAWEFAEQGKAYWEAQLESITHVL